MSTTARKAQPALELSDADGDWLTIGAGQDHLLARAANGGVYLNRDRATALRDYLTEWLGDDLDVKGRPCGVTPSRSCDCPGDGQCPALEADERPSDFQRHQTVLEEAQQAVYGDREGDYGHPREDFTRTAVIWTGLLQHKLADGAYIEAEDIPRCMIGVKLSRDVHTPKRDNRVDGAGYFLTLDRLETGR